MWKKREFVEPPEPVETNIWDCQSEDCNTWMREAFCYEESPNCPLCQSPMQKDIRSLVPIEEFNWTTG